MKGSIELRADISHCVARARAAGSRGRSPGLEQHKTVFLENGHLTEGLQGAVLRLVLLSLAEEAGLVGKSRFLECPACAQVAHLALGELRNPFEC
jgi:hypothetical protein